MKLEVRNVTKTIKHENTYMEILKGVNMECQSGEIVAIVGNSGSGKSTFLNILAMIDTCSSGEYYIEGIDAFRLSDNDRVDFRAKNIGIVFQQYNLINNLSCYDNVKIPLYVNHAVPKKDRDKWVREKLEMVGMTHRISHFPKTLSGGEQQRVAIARAIINEPKIILADEPTGNVDLENEHQILKLFRSIAKKGKLVIMVTHSQNVMAFADTVYKINEGYLEKTK